MILNLKPCAGKDSWRIDIRNKECIKTYDIKLEPFKGEDGSIMVTVNDIPICCFTSDSEFLMLPGNGVHKTQLGFRTTNGGRVIHYSRKQIPSKKYNDEWWETEDESFLEAN